MGGKQEEKGKSEVPTALNHLNKGITPCDRHTAEVSQEVLKRPSDSMECLEDQSF